MRFITKHIHRAFPELDRFSVELRARYIRAARGGWLRQVGQGAILLVVTHLLVFVGIVCTGLLFSWCERLRLIRTEVLGVREGVFVLVILCGNLAIILLPAFALRDWMLRRRIRYVLRARGVCAGCRYNLAGLAVSSSSSVTCPECGMEGTVDPSLGEVVMTESGGAVYQPRAAVRRSLLARGLGAVKSGLLKLVPGPVRERVSRRVALLGLALVLTIGLTWGGLVFYRVGFAAPGAPGAFRERLTLVMRAGQGGAAGDPRAWDTLERAITLSSRAERDAVALVSMPAGLDYSSLTRPLSKSAQERWRDERVRWLSAKAIKLAMESGLEEELAAIARTQEFSIRVPTGLIFATALPERPEIRRLSRLCCARMRLAAEAGDGAERLRAFGQALALSRAAGANFGVVDGLVSFAVRAQALERLREDLWEYPLSEEDLRSALAMMDRQIRGPSIVAYLERERIGYLDLIECTFTDTGDGNGRLNTTGPMLCDTFNIGQDTAVADLIKRLPGPGLALLGLLAADKKTHVAAVNAYFDGLVGMAGVPAAEWEGLAFQPLAFVRALPFHTPFIMDMQRLRGALQSDQQVRLLTAGTRIVLGLELHRIRTGGYPERLEALGPEDLPELPEDCVSRRPWGYRRLAPGEDPFGRGFLLYSIGADREDNGGSVPDPKTPAYEAVIPGAGKGSDFVINTPSALAGERVTPGGKYPPELEAGADD